MEPLEVPSWQWDTTLPPTVVAALLDAADATNDCVLALSHARNLEQHADTAWQRAHRGFPGEGPCRQATAHAISGAASRYGDELLRLYAWQAFHFARLAVAALTARVGAASFPPPLDADPLPIARLHADPTTLPAPPTPTPDVPIGDDLLPAYAAVLDAVEFGRGDPAHPPENLDRGTPYDPAIDIWGQGLAKLATALHRYGNLCLWQAAGRPVSLPD